MPSDVFAVNCDLKIPHICDNQKVVSRLDANSGKYSRGPRNICSKCFVHTWKAAMPA